MIHLVTIDPDFGVGVQPRGLEYLELRLAGYGSVISLHRDDYRKALSHVEEDELVRAAGMRFFHMPINPDAVSDVDVGQFRRLLMSAPRRVFVHCKNGDFAGAFVLMHLSAIHHWNAAQTLATAREHGFECENMHLMERVSEYANARCA